MFKFQIKKQKQQACPAKLLQRSGGFTLLEILLVVGIIALLAGVVIIAINPARQLATVRNTERKSDLKEVHSAMQQFYIDHSYYPASSSLSTLSEICNTGTASTSVTGQCDNLTDLSALVPDYLVAIPADPNVTTADGTGYQILENPSRHLILIATGAELNGIIAIGTSTAPGGNQLVTHAVTFNANGGTGSMDPLLIISGDSANLTSNSFTRTSYTFAGWATSIGGAVAYPDNSSYTMGSNNVTLYAQWTEWYASDLPSGSIHWSNASSSCASLSTAGGLKPGIAWRLPTIYELEALYNNQSDPTPVGFTADYYWSSTMYNYDGNTTEYVYIFWMAYGGGSGNLNDGRKMEDNPASCYTRCVR